MKNLLTFFFVAILVCSCLGKSPEQWKSRTIYQVLTDRFARNDGAHYGCDNLGNYCGGGYRGIINNLNYIKGMGFDAIWISPIVDNYDGGYHGYWARNMYGLNGNFGSQQDFRDFVQACHNNDIWVMVDIVGNHMGNTDQNYGQNNPFNSGDHFHQYCIISDSDFQNKNMDRIMNCRLAGLADLNQENDWVRTQLLNWIKDLVNKYQIDGIRIDTVPQVPKWFWGQFREASGVYTVGQVFDGDMGYVAGYVGPLDACLNYPFYYWVRDTVFNFKDMTNLRNYYSEWAKRMDSGKLSLMANFIDNHDNERVLSWSGDWQSKKKHLKTTNLMALTSIGIPIVYYGTQQYFAGGGDPRNREILWNNLDTNSDMYKFLGTAINARKKYQIWNQPQVERFADFQLYAYSRGQFLVVLTNKVGGTVQKYISYHPFSNGQIICNIFYPDNDCITVSGGFNVSLLNGQAKVYVPK